MDTIRIKIEKIINYNNYHYSLSVQCGQSPSMVQRIPSFRSSSHCWRSTMSLLTCAAMITTFSTSLTLVFSITSLELVTSLTHLLHIGYASVACLMANLLYLRAMSSNRGTYRSKLAFMMKFYCCNIIFTLLSLLYHRMISLMTH